MSPSRVNLHGPAVAGRLPAQPSAPQRTAPHPFAPLPSTLSILVTQGKPVRDYASHEQCPTEGSRKPYVLFHMTLTKSRSFCFPFHLHRTFLRRPSSSEETSNVCYRQPGNTSFACSHRGLTAPVRLQHAPQSTPVA